jgi:hypothetical protein
MIERVRYGQSLGWGKVGAGLTAPATDGFVCAVHASYVENVTEILMNAVGIVERPLPDELRVLSERLRTALALHKDGVAMKRAQLRRQDRTASEEEITMRLAAWLRTRPGASFGDAEGIGRRMCDSP